MSRLKVLLVDDNPEFLEVAADFLSQHPGMEIVGLARSGRQALQMAAELSPHLVIMDLSMPEMNGLEATRRIKTLPPPAPYVVILTLHEGAEFRSSAQGAGADNFVTKSEFGDLLVPLILHHFPQLQIEPANECA